MNPLSASYSCRDNFFPKNRRPRLALTCHGLGGLWPTLDERTYGLAMTKFLQKPCANKISQPKFKEEADARISKWKMGGL
jgi:hypothetical protein